MIRTRLSVLRVVNALKRQLTFTARGRHFDCPQGFRPRSARAFLLCRGDGGGSSRSSVGWSSQRCHSEEYSCVDGQPRGVQNRISTIRGVNIM